MKTNLNFRKNIIPFTQVANEVLANKELSLQAKGLYAYLYSKPENWHFSYTRIAEEMSNGEKSVLAAIKELEVGELLKRIKQPDGRTIYWVTYPPGNFLLDPTTQKGELGMEKPTAEKGELGVPNCRKSQLAKIGTISNTVLNTSNTKYISASAEKEFNFLEELYKLKAGPQRSQKIVAHYWAKKEYVFTTHKMYRKNLLRDITAANNLSEYSSVDIEKAMRFCEKNYPQWTLETVFKRIPDIANKKND